MSPKPGWPNSSISRCRVHRHPNFYKEQTASGTEYYYQLLPEEDTHLVESFYVTQEGVFDKGLVEMESLYAPEYRAHTAGGTVKSE